jgi:hypothetical protein
VQAREATVISLEESILGLLKSLKSSRTCTGGGGGVGIRGVRECRECIYNFCIIHFTGGGGGERILCLKILYRYLFDLSKIVEHKYMYVFSGNGPDAGKVLLYLYCCMY